MSYHLFVSVYTKRIETSVVTNKCGMTLIILKLSHVRKTFHELHNVDSTVVQMHCR